MEIAIFGAFYSSNMPMGEQYDKDFKFKGQRNVK